MGIDIGPDGSPIVVPDKPKSDSLNSDFIAKEVTPTTIIPSPSDVSTIPAVETPSAVDEAKAKAVRDEATRTKPPVKEPQIVVPPTSSGKKELLEKISHILKEHDGLESNIPIHHIYWDLVNQSRATK